MRGPCTAGTDRTGALGYQRHTLHLPNAVQIWYYRSAGRGGGEDEV